MSEKTYFRNGRIVTETGSFHGGVVAEDGLIGQLVRGDADLGITDTVDLGGAVLLPGIIDAHTHFSEPGRSYEG